MTGLVRNVVVAVPARNEELLLPRCLTALAAARETLRGTHPEIGVEVVLALDLCVDGSARAAAPFDVTVVQVSNRCVGATRDSAVRAGLSLRSTAGRTTGGTWVANTDADTVVPADWLVTQVSLAESGLDLVLGTVEPDLTASAELLRRWHRRHVLADGHSSVHGANLGVRASTWEAVGGFGALGLHEDVALVERAIARGARWTATDRGRVKTSARTQGRVDAGFAGYLRDLMASDPLTAEALP